MTTRIKLILLTALTILVQGSFAAAPPLKEWQKCIGGSAQDIPGALIRSRDGNILLLSNVDSQNGDIASNHGSTDIWLTKLDISGSILWQKSIGGSSIDVGTSISELNNGNLIITGYTSSSNGDIPSNRGNFDVLLMCADSTGKILWTKIYGGSQVDLCYSHAVSADGGFILGGGTYSNDGDVSGNHGDQDFWVMKTDSNGNLVWQKSCGGNDIDVCYAVSEDATGNIIACGTTNSPNINLSTIHGNFDLWVVKFNSTGTILWNKTFGGTNYETAQTLLIDANQNILIGGYTRSNDGDVSFNNGFADSWIIQIDNAGNLLKEKSIGGSGSENLYSVLGTADGGYLFTSGTTSINNDVHNHIGQEDIWLYKVDASWNIEWTKSYGGTGNDRPVSVIQNADGGFLVAGYTFSNNNDVNGQHGSADIWLLDLSCRVPVSFFTTAGNACIGDTMSFIDASTYTSQISWSVDNLPYSTSSVTGMRFATPNVFHVTLTAQTCYYSSNFSNDITVIDCNLPQVNFALQSQSICANSQLTFHNVSLNSTSWQWGFPGGNPASSTEESPVVTYTQPGTYSVMLTATNSYGSQTIMRLNYVTVNALPQVPVISAQGNELISTPANQYQWFYNSSAIPAMNAQNYDAFLDGYYSVQVQDNNGCTSVSDPVYYSMTRIAEEFPSNELKVYPNPTSGQSEVKLISDDEGYVRVINSAGQVVLENRIEKNQGRTSIDISVYAKGIYKVMFIGDNGKTRQKSLIKY